MISDKETTERLEEALAELEDGHAALDRAGAPRTEEGVPLALCERVNALAARLR